MMEVLLKADTADIFTRDFSSMCENEYIWDWYVFFQLPTKSELT